jgi:menaquinol-cytochrome c reductase iron-sulfur subunit
MSRPSSLKKLVIDLGAVLGGTLGASALLGRLAGAKAPAPAAPRPAVAEHAQGGAQIHRDVIHNVSTAITPAPPTESAASRQPAKQADQTTLSRRQFLAKLSIAAGGFGASIVGIPIVGVLLSPLVRKAPETWRAVGAVDSFKIGDTVKVDFLDTSPLPWAGVTARTAAWLRRESAGEFKAFAINCTHLGCPVSWLPDADLFMCPCHGGVFYKDGSVAAGPPPRPLFTYPTRTRGGQVEIQTSQIPIG